MTKNYLLAIAALMGTIIGVGLFTIPYVVNKSGVIPLFIFMVGLAAIQYYLQLLFAEAIMSTKEKHRLPGLVGRYASRGGKIFASAVEIIGVYGSILVYIIVGGIFLHQLVGPYWGGEVFIYATALFAAVTLITFFDLKMLAGTELVLTTLLVLAIGLIVWRGLGHVQLSNFHLINWPNALLPYGPIFFAVGGGTAIPEICRLLAYEKNKIRSAIAWGTFIPAVLMTLFVLVVLGITGAAATPDTLTGLAAVMSDGIVAFSLIFGLLSIITSYIVFAQALEEIFQWDLGLNNKSAWFLACFVPYLLYLIGWDDLIKVVSLTGAVTGGLSGIILIWLMFKIKAKPEVVSAIKNKLTKPAAWFLSLLFVLGFIYEIFNNF